MGAPGVGPGHTLLNALEWRTCFPYDVVAAQFQVCRDETGGQRFLSIHWAVQNGSHPGPRSSYTRQVDKARIMKRTALLLRPSPAKRFEIGGQQEILDRWCDFERRRLRNWSAAYDAECAVGKRSDGRNY
jgi:hypothetical protein